MGKRASNSSRKTVTTSLATSWLTIISPAWTLPSKPQWARVSRRRSSMGTGHPSCHEDAIRARVASSILATVASKAGSEGTGGAVSDGTVLGEGTGIEADGPLRVGEVGMV